MAKSPPCLGCEDRRVDCHVWCMDYKLFAEEREQIRESKAKEVDHNAYTISSVERMRKRKWRNG